MNHAVFSSISKRGQNSSLLVAIIACICSLIGLLINRTQFFHSYLFAWLFWSGISFGAFVIVAMQYLTGGKWGIAILPLARSAMAVLPLMALLFIPILLGMQDIYVWTHGFFGEPGKFLHKHEWLNAPGFIARSILYLLILGTIVVLLRRWSIKSTYLPEPPLRVRALSSGGLVVYVLCMNYASTDWVMSLTPQWYSTIFVVVFMAGHFLSALALMTLILVGFARSLPEGERLPTKAYWDLGNLLLAFVIFWTYVSFSQLLIIWSGNLPKEISWYLQRVGGGWQWVAGALALVEFFLPLWLLLFRPNKKNKERLALISICILIGSILNAFWLVMPSFHPNGITVHWLDLALFVGLGGFWFALFFWILNQTLIIPPNLVEVGNNG